MKKEITFSFPAEAMQGATEIYLLGDFNNWNIEDAIRFEYALDGFFRAVALLEEGQTYNYRFLLDNGNWVNDHNADAYMVIPELYVDNCVITVPVSSMQKENTQAEESRTKSAAKPKNSTDSGSKKTTAESDSKKASAEPAPKKGSTDPAPKKATAKAEPAKAAGTKKPVAKAAKANADEKKSSSPKGVKKSAPKPKK